MAALRQFVLPGLAVEEDVCARKHGGNRMSRKAHEHAKVNKVSMRERCRIFVASGGFYGATLAEICKAFGKEKNCLSGRLSELRERGEIYDSKRERDGFSVYVTDKRHVALWAHEVAKP